MLNFEPLRRLHSKLSVALVAAAAIVLSSCGGGGATSSPTGAGSLQLLPGAGSLYAGVPYKFTVAGGRKPYLVTSSEPTLVELNFTLDGNEFTIVPRNPGVVDVGLDPDEVPRRTVNIEVRDSVGAAITNSYNVLQNFFTGYREGYASTCPAPTGGSAPQACSGSDTIISLFPVSNGALYGGRQYQFDKVRGDYQFVVEDPSVTPQLVNQIRVRTDQVGVARVRLRVTNNAPTQLATYKITDILTGVTTDAVFLIVQSAPADAIAVLPDSVTFTGSLSTRCGSGQADVFIFGGTPPYTLTPSAGVSVSPTTVDVSGGRFQLTLGLAAPPCPSGQTVVVADSRGALATVTVDNQAGSGSPPALTASPTSITLLCGQGGQVTVVGGSGSGYSATSSHPRVSASVSGSTVSISRAGGDGGVNYPTTGSVTVTDGTSLVSIGVTGMPATCP
jgi:hypothetical protein